MSAFFSVIFASKLSSRLVSLLVLLSVATLLSTGCSTVRPNYEAPTVSVTSFKPLPSEGLIPRFEIGMRVVNPNAASLSLRGMSYKIMLNDFEVIDGAANALPVVPAYGEAEFKFTAGIGLFEGMRFVNDLLQKSHANVAYRLQSKLDVGALLPTIKIEKTGDMILDKSK